MFSCICMAITAPMKSEIIITRGIESNPSFEISARNLRPVTFHLSGIANTRHMNMQ